MTKRMLACCAGLLFAGAAGLYAGCNDTITGQDCKVKCQDVDNTCVQKCNNDMQCQTVCSTDLDNCVASCGSVTATPPAKPDGG